MITNTLDLNIPTHTDFDEEVCRYLQTFVVVYDDDYVEWDCISFQYQFLCRAVYLSLLEDKRTLRTYYKRIFAQYTQGDFKRSGIRLLELSKAVSFSCKRDFVLYRVSPEIIRHVSHLLDRQ